MLNTINVAASGLAASREQVESVMNNIANENTPGYKKRSVNISEASHIDSRLTGRGVLIGDTTRVVNIYMYDNLTSEKSKQSEYDELSMMLSDIESIFYETDDSGFSSDLDRYFQAIENLRSSPSNEIYKNNLRNTGIAITNDLKTLYSDIEQRELAAKNTIDDHVEEVNTILNDIGNVNKTLSDIGFSSNDLLDKRDQLEQEIANYIDVDIDRTDNYELKITNMTAVRFDTNIHSVSIVSDKIAQKNIYANTGNPHTSNLVNMATWEDSGDKVSFKLNNSTTVSVSYGEVVNGTAVDKNNVVQSLVYKINHTANIDPTISAYNGQYILDAAGNKILTNNPKHPEYDAINPNKDRYLVIEADIPGDKGKFDCRILVEDSDASSSALNLAKNSDLSVKGIDDVHLEIFDRKLTLKSGKLKALTNNLDSASSDNLFIIYKEKLDNLAKALSDLSGSYIKNDDETYVYGNTAVDVNANRTKRVDIGLFSGGTVDSLEFNDSIVGALTQEKLDYLASLQWKTDINIDGTGENLTSFSKYNQTLRVKIAEDKQGINFKKETQDAVTSSLQNTYDKLVKVDKDEEMINLIKFQAAYEANAKLITMIDEMLSTILGMRR
jgi:flagellar hook-associated protein 1 FlgK